MEKIPFTTYKQKESRCMSTSDKETVYLRNYLCPWSDFFFTGMGASSCTQMSTIYLVDIKYFANSYGIAPALQRMET